MALSLSKLLRTLFMEDLDKLSILLNYLRNSYEYGYKGIKLLHVGHKGIQVFGYIDASYGIHNTGHSQTGCDIHW